MSLDKPAVTVIGAGIVGVCCALELQAQGHRVSVIDPRPPGTATSFGNAGLIADAMVMPYSAPGLWRKLPRMLFSPISPMSIRWTHLPRALPWIVRFMRQGTEARTRQLATEISSLSESAASEHRRLMREHGVDGELFRTNGCLKLYRTRASLEAATLEHDVLRELGIPFEVLNSDELRQLEPRVSREFECAVYLTELGHITQSVSLTQAYAAAFESLGGRFVRETVRRFEIGPQGPWRVVTDLGFHALDQVVIAAGAWSGRFAAELGSDVPLESERGYHMSVDWSEGVTLNRPIVDCDRHFVVVPMRDGIRVTSGTEMGGLELPPDFTRIRRLLGRARTIVDGLDGEVHREWMGHRPSMADSKPVIGRSPHFANVYFAFGHGHSGLTQSATTATVIAQLIAGAVPMVDLEPFRADRF